MYTANVGDHLKELLSSFQEPQKLTNERARSAVMSQPSVYFNQSATLHQTPAAMYVLYVCLCVCLLNIKLSPSIPTSLWLAFQTAFLQWQAF